MLKKVALVFGVVFTLVGILGFVPGITVPGENGMGLLLGLFMVDAVHNWVHILSGLTGLAASTSAKYSKWYLIGFGAVYALVTLLGLLGMNPVLGFIHVNAADNVLHLVLTIGLLGAGLGLSENKETAAI
jgi:hypothetical protein